MLPRAGTVTPVDRELAFALELADAADAVSTPRFRARDLVVEAKPDLTPVSDADRAVEDELRRRIGRARPAHAVVGEELGDEGAGPWRWVLDPIDATKNFVRGIPVWATLIALEHDGEGVVGVVSAPALGRRWWAARGEGAFADGAPCRVSAVSALADAQLSYDGIADRFLALARRCWRARGFGDFWSHVLLAEGGVDVVVEPEVAHWDLAAVKVIVEEAGGRLTDLAGEPRADGGSAVSTNGLLHDEVLAALR